MSSYLQMPSSQSMNWYNPKFIDILEEQEIELEELNPLEQKRSSSTSEYSDENKISPLNFSSTISELSDQNKTSNQSRSSTMSELSESNKKREILEISDNTPSSVDILISPRYSEARKSRSFERISRLRTKSLHKREISFRNKKNEESSKNGEGSPLQKARSFRILTPRISAKKRAMPRTKSYRTIEEKNKNFDAMNSEEMLNEVRNVFIESKNKYLPARILCNQFNHVDPEDMAKVLLELFTLIDNRELRIPKKRFYNEVGFLAANQDLAPCVSILSKKMDQDFPMEIFKVCNHNKTTLLAITFLTKYELSLSEGPETLFRSDSLVTKLNTAYLNRILHRKNYFKALKHQLDHELKKVKNTLDLDDEQDIKTFTIFTCNLLNYIYEAPLPKQCQMVLKKRFNLVIANFEEGYSEGFSEEFAYVSVGELFFLRVLNPFICSNEKYLKSRPMMSALKPFSKILQNICNNTTFGVNKNQKNNPTLEKFNELIEEHFPVHIKYLKHHSTK